MNDGIALTGKIYKDFVDFIEKNELCLVRIFTAEFPDGSKETRFSLHPVESSTAIRAKEGWFHLFVIENK